MKFLQGFLIGFLSGAAAGLVLAPGSGEENRERFLRRYEEARAAARQASQEHEEKLLARYRLGVGTSQRDRPGQA